MLPSLISAFPSTCSPTPLPPLLVRHRLLIMYVCLCTNTFIINNPQSSNHISQQVTSATLICVWSRDQSGTLKGTNNFARRKHIPACPASGTKVTSPAVIGKSLKTKQPWKASRFVYGKLVRHRLQMVNYHTYFPYLSSYPLTQILLIHIGLYPVLLGCMPRFFPYY